jgi:hypothetical protein
MTTTPHHLRNTINAASYCLAVVGFAALVGCGGSTPPATPSAPAASAAPSSTTNSAAPAVVEKKSLPETPAPASVATGWGNLTGKFVFDGPRPDPAKLDVNKDIEVCGKYNLVNEELVVDKDGGIANVVIYVRSKDVKVHPDAAKLAEAKPLCDNHGCRFEPHILGVLVGQTCVLHNADTVAHNMNCQPLGDQGINPLIPPMGEFLHKFGRAQSIPTPITCNIHPWMKGYILPRDNPYFAVSKPDGSFELANLPAGELEFQAWHEKKGYLSLDGWDKGRFKQTIQPGENSLEVKKIPAAWFSN